MLLIGRREGEVIRIGDNITVKVVRIEGGKIRLGITAPPEVPVHREEIQDEIDAEKKNRPAS